MKGVKCAQKQQVNKDMWFVVDFNDKKYVRKVRNILDNGKQLTINFYTYKPSIVNHRKLFSWPGHVAICGHYPLFLRLWENFT